MIVRDKSAAPRLSEIRLKLANLKKSSVGPLGWTIDLIGYNGRVTVNHCGFTVYLMAGRGRIVYQKFCSRLREVKSILGNPAQTVKTHESAATYDKTNPPSWIR